jgi:hypothetical protein
MNVGPPIHLYMCTFARGLSTHTRARERERVPLCRMDGNGRKQQKGFTDAKSNSGAATAGRKRKKLLIDSILADVDEPRLPPMVRLCDESSRDLNLSSRFAIHRL